MGELHSNLKCIIFSLRCCSLLPQTTTPLLDYSLPVLQNIAICYITYSYILVKGLNCKSNKSKSFEIIQHLMCKHVNKIVRILRAIFDKKKKNEQ
jgi:hypothetical protein